MKRLLTALLALLCAAALALPAAADIIWEPDNAFYNRHRSECTYVDRWYLTAGYNGSVQLYDAPGGMAKEQLPNGQKVTIQYQWNGRDFAWGMITGLNGDWDHGVWVPMDDVSLIYDSEAFFTDHGEEIATVPHGEMPVIPEDGSVDFTEAVVYRYPCGPVGGTLKENTAYMKFNEAFSALYTDGDGLRWGYISYYMGERALWICLDDPMNEHLDTGVVETPPSTAQLRGAPTVIPGLWQRPWLLAAVLVAAVVAVTVLLIRKKYPRKQ